MHRGWIKIHRKMAENPVVWKDTDHAAIWLFLLLNATHKRVQGFFGGKLIDLEPGQVITGRRKISEHLRVHESKVQRVLSLMESEHLIEQRTDRQSRLVTVVCWEKYQSDEQLNEQRMNNDRTTSEQRVNTEQECKNVKKENHVVSPPTRKAKTDAVKKNKKPVPTSVDLSALIIPEYFTADDEWPELWADWQEHRRNIKKPLTLLSAKQQIKAMDEWGLGASIESLRQSLSNGWQGLFKPKGHDLALHDPYGAVHSDKERQEMIEWADKFYKEQEAKEKLAREEEERLYGNGEGRDQEGA
jgi:DNA-binding transcriptional regulator YhcF (GntR family)